MPAPKKPEASMNPIGPKREPAIAADLRTVDTANNPGTYISTGKDVDEQLAYDPSWVEDEVAKEEDVQQYLPTDRIPAGEIIYIRNNTSSLVRWADSPKEAIAKFNIRLAPAGDQDSIVSIDSFEVLRNPGFQKWWRAGKLTVSGDQSIAPKTMSTLDREAERLQQITQNSTLERTAPGSLPVSKDLDLTFLDEAYADTHKGRPRPPRG